MNPVHAEENFIYDGSRGGVFCEKHSLAPWPGVILRRIALFDCIEHVSPSSYLEVGFGSGRFTYEFYRRGFDCTGYDFNRGAVSVADDIFNRKDRIIDFRDYLIESDKGKYDCLGAFEVLEHNEDDAFVINEWRSLMKLGGHIVISVPARMKYWQPSDEKSGHIRRYEKDGLHALLTNNGFEIVKFINWGFPILNIIKPVSNMLINKPALKQVGRLSLAEKTKLSGVDHSREYRYLKFIPFRAFNFMGKVQRLFYNKDWGEGYMVVARRVL